MCLNFLTSVLQLRKNSGKTSITKLIRPGIDGTPPGTIASCHPLGWIQIHIFTDWMRHFTDVVHPSLDDPVVLILDGHYSHIRNMDIINLARVHGVIIVCIPPHTSHRLQPLDVAFMKPFKSYYSSEIETWLAAHPFRSITVYHFSSLMGRAYIRAATIEVAINGFKKTGISPFDPLSFGPQDFIEEAESGDGLLEESANPQNRHRFLHFN